MSSMSRRCRNSRSLSPPKCKNDIPQESTTCDRCDQQHASGFDKKKKKDVSATKDKSQQTKIQDQPKVREDYRYANSGRRNSAPRPSYAGSEASSRNVRQANLVCSKHEKEKIKMQAAIDKLQDAFVEKESKLQDARSQLVRERRMSEIMERQLKNSRNLSEQLGRIIHEREQEIRTLKNSLNKKHDTRSISDVHTTLKSNSRTGERRKIPNSRDEFHTSIRRSSSTSEHSECNTLSSASVDKMLKEVHSLVEGLKIKDEAIKGLQEECTRRLDKIQTLQRNLQMLQDKLTHSAQHHSNVCAEKDNIIAQLQHSLKETEATVESLLSEKTKVVQEGANTINGLQEIIHQNELTIQKVQMQLQEALESKENEVNQLKSNIERQQWEIDSKHKALDTVSEELYSSQMEAESLKMELSKEKCSLNKMSEEINSLVEKLTRAVSEMESTKHEYQKKDDKLKAAHNTIRDLYMSFFGDHALVDKIQILCKRRRQHTGRRVLSEEDVIYHLSRHRPRGNKFSALGNMTKNNMMEMSNAQIHKQQLAELQQQVNESQSVCGLLQEQLREVTDFLDQLLHIEISPKNLSALSVIRQYGKQLQTPVNILSISKERIAPDGISSNSQLDLESSKKVAPCMNDCRNSETNFQPTEVPKPFQEARHGSCGNLKYYQQEYFQEAMVNEVNTFRSISAEDVQHHQNHMNTFSNDCLSLSTPWDQADDTEKPEDEDDDDDEDDSASNSDEILLLINDRNVTSDGDDQQKRISRPALSLSPPFQHGLVVVKENYGSTGSINTRDKETYPSLERSASFGSFSGSVLMSYDQSEKASNEDSGLMRSRCVRSIDMMDIIQVGHPATVGVGLSSDTDIWSEPDMWLSRQRMGLMANDSNASSNNESSPVSDSSDSFHRRRKFGVQLKGDTPKKNVKGFWHHPVRKYASKLKRWLERLKCYLHVFEEASYNLTDELNNLCQVRTDLLSLISSNAENERNETLDVILSDLAEYIRLNYDLQRKVEKTIHYNRQLIDASGKNVSHHNKPNATEEEAPARKQIAHITPETRFRRSHSPKSLTQAITESQPINKVVKPNQEASDIHSQLISYHATLLSCQDMIKDLHSQLKERHCSELVNKHELNRTVYGYLEDIDTCIEELCKKMENTGESVEMENVNTNYAGPLNPQNRVSYPTFSSILMEKLKENEDRLLRFEALLNHKEQQLKMSADNALQLEVQLNSIKQSLYEIQMENLELKECLEFSESKQLEIEDSSNQMLRDLQLTMQRLSDLEERFRCIDSVTTDHKSDDDYAENNDPQTSSYPVEYDYPAEDEWQEVVVDPPDEDDYSQDWESRDY